MAVGGRTRHYLGGDLPLRARSILDDEWLAETLRQPLTNQAREDVGWTAGRKADHDPHRPRRVGLRPRDTRHRRQRGGARGQTEKISPGKFHFEPCLSLAASRVAAWMCDPELPSNRPKRDGHHRRSPRSACTTQPKNLVGRLDMSERRITQLFGLVLGAIVTCTLVLNAFAFKPKTVLSETENPLSQKKETPGGGLSNKPIASAACAAVLWFH